jgi:hypothetical protein
LRRPGRRWGGREISAACCGLPGGALGEIWPQFLGVVAPIWRPIRGEIPAQRCGLLAGLLAADPGRGGRTAGGERCGGLRPILAGLRRSRRPAAEAEADPGRLRTSAAACVYRAIVPGASFN